MVENTYMMQITDQVPDNISNRRVEIRDPDYDYHTVIEPYFNTNSDEEMVQINDGEDDIVLSVDMAIKIAQAILSRYQ